VVRDSLGAVRDIAAIRSNWAIGRYRTPLLHDLLQAELRRDVDEAAGHRPQPVGPDAPDAP
jgi:hypothetical protein